MNSFLQARKPLAMNTMTKEDGDAWSKGCKGWNFTHPDKFEQVIFALPSDKGALPSEDSRRSTFSGLSCKLQ